VSDSLEAIASSMTGQVDDGKVVRAVIDIALQEMLLATYTSAATANIS